MNRLHFALVVCVAIATPSRALEAPRNTSPETPREDAIRQSIQDFGLSRAQVEAGIVFENQYGKDAPASQ